MRVKSLCAALVVLAFVSTGYVFADQKIKTKSNIKNDRVAQSVENSECGEKCSEGEQCVKLPADDTVAAEKTETNCVAVSEIKSSIENKEAH